MPNTPSTLLLYPPTTASSARAEFYDCFRHEADRHHREIVKRCDEYFHIMSILASLSSAIAYGLILLVSNPPHPSYALIASSSLTTVLGQAPVYRDPTLIHTQAVLSSALVICIIAAFIAFLSKEWLCRFSQGKKHGPLAYPGQDRSRRINRASTWHINFAMGILPLMLFFAFALLIYASSTHFLAIENVTTSTVAGLIASSCFYSFLIPVTPPLYNYPFQDGRNYNLPTLSRRETDLDGYTQDSDHVTWMLERSKNEDVMLVIMNFIPEIFWHNGILVTPLERVYDTTMRCLDDSFRHRVMTPALVHCCAKALLHLIHQRKCMGNKLDDAALASISCRHKATVPRHYEGDPDLESTLQMVDRALGIDDPKPMPWSKFFFTIPHHIWVSSTLFYPAWHSIKIADPLPEDIEEFILHSLQLENPPPAVVRNCLLIIGLVLGIGLDVGSQKAIGISCSFRPQTDAIYKKLIGTFQNKNPTTREISHALEALKLIAPLREKEIASKSYALFHVVIRAPISPAYTQEKKWEVSRLALRGAFKWDEIMPSVGDPQDILTFLNYHFYLVTSGVQNQDEPIQDALRALAYASGSDTIEALKHLDPTGPSFVHGMRFAFQVDRPLQLRKAALFFLPLIGDRWFNAPHPFMGPGEMRSFCVDWASAVDDSGHAYDIQEASLAILFDMINSPHWRPYIVTEKWKLLERFVEFPGDSQPLRRCLDNPELPYALSKTENPNVIRCWSAIWMLKFEELVPKVREQLEMVMKVTRRSDLEQYLSVGSEQVQMVQTGWT